MATSRRRSSAARPHPSPSGGSSHPSPSLLPHSLRDLRTDSEQNFGFLLTQRPNALEEQRIQRLIEDQLLHHVEDAEDTDGTPSSPSPSPPPSSPPSPTLPPPLSSSLSSSSSAAAAPPPKARPPTTLPASLTALLPSASHASPSSAFSLRDLLPFVSHGIEKTVQDDFSRCFQSAHSPAWNWNLYLYPLWLLGVLTRYLVLLPLRCLCIALGALLWLSLLLVIRLLVPAARRGEWERWNIRFFCSAFVLSWTGVIRYHGTIPAHKPNQIYVANHTSLIDMVILSQMNTFSLVGQRQAGFVGFMQRNVLSCLNNCFFDRAEAEDRSTAALRIKAHIQSPTSNRLLIFPEGTCVNNEYVVQFKQGAFDMGAEVVPIAIKYNKIFVDAFWNSRAQSFPMHLLTLMCSWAVVCDVWYLAPQRKLEHETPIEFSERVKRMIAERAGLKNVAWDGYLKHFRASARYMKEQQGRVAEAIKRRWAKLEERRRREGGAGQPHEEKEPEARVAAISRRAPARKGSRPKDVEETETETGRVSRSSSTEPRRGDARQRTTIASQS